MDTKEKPDLLVLKVMRLTRPSLCSIPVVTSDTSDLPCEIFNDKLLIEPASVAAMEALAVGQLFIVPQNFGTIFLGQVFSCYICIRNDSMEPVEDVTLKADLQTCSQTVTLLDGRHSVIIAEDTSYSKVIHHEVKEIGTHILVCEVTYGRNKVLRKFFKFQVLKPLNVKSKFYVCQSEQVCLEAEIQNTTSTGICFESIYVKCADNFSPVKNMHCATAATVDDSVFGESHLVEKDSARQYFFYLSPSNVNGMPVTVPAACTEEIDVGILDIVWRSTFGERGHLQTSTLRTAYERDIVRVAVVEQPDVAFSNSVFELKCHLSNLSEFSLSMQMLLDQQQSFVWCTKCDTPMGTVPACSFVQLNLSLLPLRSGGLLDICGIRMIETRSGKCYPFDNISQILVLNDVLPPSLPPST